MISMKKEKTDLYGLFYGMIVGVFVGSIFYIIFQHLDNETFDFKLLFESILVFVFACGAFGWRLAYLHEYFSRKKK